jgi:membrane fusion protein (multidrug efflux system)
MKKPQGKNPPTENVKRPASGAPGTPISAPTPDGAWQSFDQAAAPGAPKFSQGGRSFQFSSGSFVPPGNGLSSPRIAKPATPPKQPKGRVFIVGLLIAVMAFAMHQVWNSFLRYQAYGVVSGRIIDVPSPLEGCVRFVHVQEGETVSQGQLLLTLHNPEYEQRQLDLAHALRSADAELRSAVSRLKWEHDRQELDNVQAVAEFYETWGRIRDEQSKLLEAQDALSRATELAARKVITAQELEKARFTEQGQREMIDKKLTGLKALQRRAELAHAASVGDRAAELEPLRARIDNLSDEQARLKEFSARQEVRAPCHGVIVKRHVFTGEGAKKLDPLVSILEQDSLHVELYLPQNQSQQLRPGDEIEVLVDPFSERLACEVVRCGDTHVVPPDQLQRHFPHQARVLPIYLRPRNSQILSSRVQVGAVVKQPLQWHRQIDSSATASSRSHPSTEPHNVMPTDTRVRQFETWDQSLFDSERKR